MELWTSEFFVSAFRSSGGLGSAPALCLGRFGLGRCVGTARRPGAARAPTVQKLAFLRLGVVSVDFGFPRSWCKGPDAAHVVGVSRGDHARAEEIEGVGVPGGPTEADVNMQLGQILPEREREKAVAILAQVFPPRSWGDGLWNLNRVAASAARRRGNSRFPGRA